MTDNRRPCREGHFDCLTKSQRGDTCNMDPARCERGVQWKGSHLWDDDYETGRRYCIRCARGPLAR